MRTSRAVWILASLIVMLSVLGCNATPRPDAHATLVELTANSTVAVRAGGRLIVQLSSHAGTGYQWRCTNPSVASSILRPDFDVEKATGQEVPRSTPPEMVGGGVITTFDFTALAAGECQVAFALERPWEKQRIPAETRVLCVKVQAK